MGGTRQIFLEGAQFIDADGALDTVFQVIVHELLGITGRGPINVTGDLFVRWMLLELKRHPFVEPGQTHREERAIPIGLAFYTSLAFAALGKMFRRRQQFGWRKLPVAVLLDLIAR